jgi:hypothetical protein
MPPVLIAALALAGCNATMPQQQSRPTAADDPSGMCFKTVPDNPRIAVLKSKIPLDNPRSATVEMLSSTDRPTDEERKALSIWAEHRAACTESGRSFRARYAPPGWALAVEEGQAALTQMIANLYSGAMTYGQFNGERSRLAIQTQAKLEATSRNAQHAEAQDRRAAEQAAAIQQMQTIQILQAMQPPVVAPMAPLITPTTTCITRPSVGSVYTTCN